MESLRQPTRLYWQRLCRWCARTEHRDRARAMAEDVSRAFTEHPLATGESYWQHLWFTICMAARFVYTTVVLVLHGLLPFLLTKAASREIERIYAIMKARIPKARREQIDLDYSV